MQDNYTKYVIVYHKQMYLCKSRRLTFDVSKALVFASADDAMRFVPHDLSAGLCELMPLVKGAK